MYHYTGPRRAVCTAVTGPGARVCFSLFFVAVVVFFFFFFLPTLGRRIVATVLVDNQIGHHGTDAPRRLITATRVEKALAGFLSERARARTRVCHPDDARN